MASTTFTVPPEIPLPPFDPAGGVYGLMPLATKDPISYGAIGDTVAYMQAVLRCSAGQDLEIDGIFGPDTAGALHNLQTSADCPSTARPISTTGGQRPSRQSVILTS